MTNLKRLLFATAIVPAVALSPLVAYSQGLEGGERMERMPHGGAEGGPRPGGPGHAERGGGERMAPGGAQGVEPRPRAETPQRGPAQQRTEQMGEAPSRVPQNRRAEPDAAPRPPRDAQSVRPAEGPSRHNAESPAMQRANPALRDERRPAPAGAAERATPEAAPNRRDNAARPTPADRTRDNADRLRPGDQQRDNAARPTPADRTRDNADRLRPGDQQRDNAARPTPEDRPRDNADRLRPGDQQRDNAARPTPADRTRDNADRLRPGDQQRDNAARPTPEDRTRDNADRLRPDDQQRNNANRMVPNDRQRDNADRLNRDDNRRDADRGRISPGGAAAIGAAAGFAGGFLAATGAQRIDEIRRDRREVVEDGRTYIREPGRTIVEDGDRSFIVHDENDRFRDLGYDVRRERRGRDYVDIVDRPGGYQIVTYTDPNGQMLRRVRRDREGREYVLIDNAYGGGIRPYRDDVVALPPPPMRIPRERYVVDYRDADEGLIYDTLVAPPLAAPPRRYTLDQIRFSPDVRSYVRSVDINTINFESGSWIVPASATGKLRALASAINRAIDRNQNAVFLIEGYTDATGNRTDNLSLSDRRAQSVAAILTKDFRIPPENLTTQGYGQQNLKVNTQGPSAENRRVVVRNITQLMASGDRPPAQE